MPLAKNISPAVFGFAAGTLFAAACGSGSRDIGAARADFREHAAQCTAQYGYSPEAGAALGSFELGASERPWRQCVYDGIERYLVSSSLTPEIYRKAIAEDRVLTDGVAAGRTTRAQRAERVGQLLADIDRTEQANRAKIEQMEAVDRLVKEETARQLDPMRRSLMVPLAR
jgi:hypothetical protein